MIASKQIAFGKAAGAKKPYDAEIEYLESTGTQYLLFNEFINGIDIFILPENNAIYTSVGAWNSGSRVNGVGYSGLQSRGFLVRNTSNSSPVNSGILERDIKHVTVHGTSVTIDGLSFEMGAPWSVDFVADYFALFGCYNSKNSVVDTSACKIGSCKLYRDDVLLFDLIPVRKGNIGYMYDRVSGQLFGNQGTGEFVLGPDL